MPPRCACWPTACRLSRTDADPARPAGGGRARARGDHAALPLGWEAIRLARALALRSRIGHAVASASPLKNEALTPAK